MEEKSNVKVVLSTTEEARIINFHKKLNLI
jgi:hypothetical protein